MRRRPNGAGKRPGDSTVRISEETRKALEHYRRVTHRASSADAVFRELLDAEILRYLPRIRPTSDTVYTPNAANG